MKNLNQIKLLDCSLRDGGYYNKWDFSYDFINKYGNYIDSLPVEYVELGYINDTSEICSEFHGALYSISHRLLKGFKQQHKKTKLSLMVNCKSTSASFLDNYLYNVHCDIDLIRFACAPSNLHICEELVSIAKKHHIAVAVNLMYANKYYEYEDEIIDFISKLAVNDVLYVVDSYGSCFPSDIENLINFISNNFNGMIGFHGHNNNELAFINTITAISSGATFIDATVLGMGRGAGNLKLEQILLYLLKKNATKFNLSDIQSLVELFIPLKEEYRWGTNMAYMLAGLYHQPQAYIMDGLDKNRFTLDGLLSYFLKESNPCPDEKLVPIDILDTQNTIIIGGGDSVKDNINDITHYISTLNGNTALIFTSLRWFYLFNNLNVISILVDAGNESFKIKDISPEYYYSNLNYDLSGNYTPSKIIENKQPSNTVEYISPLALSLSLVNCFGFSYSYLVGFDGYSENTNISRLLTLENQKEITKSNVELISLTPSLYQNLRYKSIY